MSWRWGPIVVEQIEQLKVMRAEAQNRLEQKREVIKKQMYVLATSADARLIKSLNPLIDNLEKTLAKNIESKKLEAMNAEANSLEALNHATQALAHSSEIASPEVVSSEAVSNVLPLHPANNVDKSAEDALARALNAATPNIDKVASKPTASKLTQIAPSERALTEIASTKIDPVYLEPEENSEPMTQAQRTQFELEKIATQLRETISQDRSI